MFRVESYTRGLLHGECQHVDVRTDLEALAYFGGIYDFDFKLIWDLETGVTHLGATMTCVDAFVSGLPLIMGIKCLFPQFMGQCGLWTIATAEDGRQLEVDGPEFSAGNPNGVFLSPHYSTGPKLEPVYYTPYDKGFVDLGFDLSKNIHEWSTQITDEWIIWYFNGKPISYQKTPAAFKGAKLGLIVTYNINSNFKGGGVPAKPVAKDYLTITEISVLGIDGITEYRRA